MDAEVINGIFSVVLAIISLIASTGWIINRKQRKQEVESMRVDVRQKYLTSDMDLVKSFRDLISRPIEIEVMKLRKEVNQLRDAIQGIYDCAYRGDCPVRERLREQQESDGEERDEEDIVGC